MKKIFTLGLVLSVVTTAASASWWNKLGFGKTAEPQTLEEACNKDDLTAICPEMVIGSETMIGCLTENVTSLSKKCSKFVQKYVTENKDQAIETVNEKVEEAKKQVADAKAEQKNIKAEKKAELKQAKAELKTQKAEAKKALVETKDAVKQTGKDLKETGKSIKEAF